MLLTDPGFADARPMRNNTRLARQHRRLVYHINSASEAMGVVDMP